MQCLVRSAVSVILGVGSLAGRHAAPASHGIQSSDLAHAGELPARASRGYLIRLTVSGLLNQVGPNASPYHPRLTLTGHRHPARRYLH